MTSFSARNFLRIFAIFWRLKILSCQMRLPDFRANTLNMAGPTIRVGMLFPQSRASNRPVFADSAGAVLLAMDRAFKERILPSGTNFTYFWRYEECLEYTSVGYSYEMIKQDRIDVLIGPPCQSASRLVKLAASYSNIPYTIWGTSFVNHINDQPSTMISIMPNFLNLAMAALSVLRFFGWTTFGVVTQNDAGGCRDLLEKLDEVLNTNNNYQNFTVNYRNEIYHWNEIQLSYLIQQIKARARILLLCFDNAERLRELSLMLYDAKLYTSDYVYVIVNIDIALTKEIQQRQLPFWKQRNATDGRNDGRDGHARILAQRAFFFTLDKSRDVVNSINRWDDFERRMLERIRGWPFYCNECAANSTGDKQISPYAPYLHDTFYAYILALSNTFRLVQSTSPEFYRNGTLVSDITIDKFYGMTGLISIDKEGFRSAVFSLSAYDDDDHLVKYLSIQVIDAFTNISTLFDDASRTIWASRGGAVPRAIPECGFDGNLCVAHSRKVYRVYFIVGGALLSAFIVLGIVAIIIYALYIQRRDLQKENAQWKISFVNLVRYQKETGSTAALSRPSSLSVLTSQTSRVSKKDSVAASKRFIAFVYKTERVIGMRHELARQVEFNALDTAELRMMRQLDHENVNRFVGLCTDGPETYSLWRYCMRGSIRDVLDNNTLAHDAIFVVSIIRELCEGLCFIHQSALECHGNLKSSYCLIDERWKVKISYYGLRAIRRHEDLNRQNADELLWRAPELLRAADGGGVASGWKSGNSTAIAARKRKQPRVDGVKPANGGDMDHFHETNKQDGKKGDIYSFAIICSELVNMGRAWEDTGAVVGAPVTGDTTQNAGIHTANGSLSDTGNTALAAVAATTITTAGDGDRGRRRNAEEIVYMVKKGGLMPPRPPLRPAVNDLNPELMHLIRDCWVERPEERPKIESIRSSLRSIKISSGKGTLMDHVFSKLEKYANTLEEVVRERTQELALEQRKSDLLLYRMLPKQIADRLKLGQSVEPESYDYVTIFFSDIVSFTTISSKMKPLGVVNFLNELYTHFDSVISEFDVYKVETIGDSYLCVSGLPHRNGNAHFRNVADMSLKILRTIEHFSVASLPDEQVRVRIGIHSGPCVTGVVGLSMPRYCLFGDTVNTASRMESSSMPNKIHISNITNHFLTQTIGGYVTERRGEIIIKGKGVMETFWLVGCVDEYLPTTSTATAGNYDAKDPAMELSAADLIAGKMPSNISLTVPAGQTGLSTNSNNNNNICSRTSLRERDKERKRDDADGNGFAAVGGNTVANGGIVSNEGTVTVVSDADGGNAESKKSLAEPEPNGGMFQDRYYNNKQNPVQ